MKGPWWRSQGAARAQRYKDLSVAKKSVCKVWKTHAETRRELCTKIKNQNYMSTDVECFDLRHSNSAELKALPAAIRFSGSSCLMLEGIDGSGGGYAVEGSAC